jgi:hypothetical protein
MLDRAALNALVPFASRDLARVNLAQVAFYRDGSMAATDGHRLAVYFGVIAPKSAPPIACLQVDAAREVMKACRKSDTARITITTTRDIVVEILGKDDAVRLTMVHRDNQADATFPPIMSVLPSRHVDAADRFKGPEPAIAINGAYLAESALALGAVQDSQTCTVEIYMWGSLHPVEIRCGGWAHVIMPMRGDTAGPWLCGGVDAAREAAAMAAKAA